MSDDVMMPYVMNKTALKEIVITSAWYTNVLYAKSYLTMETPSAPYFRNVTTQHRTKTEDNSDISLIFLHCLADLIIPNGSNEFAKYRSNLPLERIIPHSHMNRRTCKIQLAVDATSFAELLRKLRVVYKFDVKEVEYPLGEKTGVFDDESSFQAVVQDWKQERNYVVAVKNEK
ncbi:hypothetical protein AKO1_001986 [Acrasis kona]|uniref:Uncharacterized protein n=1 Tax=Acrasis kona TaxID=1008807 RepID=A0AAW2ZCB1_9EUKA